MVRLTGWLIFHLIAMSLATLGTVAWGLITNMRVDLGGFTTNLGIGLVTWVGFVVMSGFIMTSIIAFLTFRQLSLLNILILLGLFAIHYIGLVILLKEVVPQVAVADFFIGAVSVFIASLAGAKLIVLIFGDASFEASLNTSRLGKR